MYQGTSLGAGHSCAPDWSIWVSKPHHQHGCTAKLAASLPSPAETAQLEIITSSCQGMAGEGVICILRVSLLNSDSSSGCACVRGLCTAWSSGSGVEKLQRARRVVGRPGVPLETVK